jgi:FtsH-binding integral membrane protein
MNATTTVKGVGGDKGLETVNMSDTTRLRYLRVMLVVVGLIFTFGIYPLGVVWPSGWAWGHGHSHYLMMILGVYATLGVFLLIASRNPAAHTSLIWFTVWSSVVHAVIMAIQAVTDGAERGHLVGDVPALLVVAIVLAALTPRAGRA